MQRILTIMINQYKFTLFGLLFYGAYDQKSTNSLGMFVVLVVHTFQGIKDSKSRTIYKNDSLNFHGQRKY